MTEPVFARTDHEYDSYRDYWRLVELSGFETRRLGAADLRREGTYVATPMSGETRAWLASVPRAERRARVVWWVLERPDPPQGPPLAAVLDEVAPLVDAVWASDRAMAALDPRVRHAVLGSHPGLGSPGAGARPYDHTHQAYACPRRRDLFAELARRHREGPACWGGARDRVLRGSRLMVSAHQTPFPAGEPLRYALAAAYGLPLACETLLDPWPLERGVHFRDAPLAGIPRLVAGALSDPAWLARAGAALRELLCFKCTFRAGVEAALADTFKET